MPPEMNLDSVSNHSSNSIRRQVRAPSQLVLRSTEEKDQTEVTAPLIRDEKPRVYLFGKDLSELSPNVQFSICTCGVFTFNVLYGYLQELLAIHIAGRRFALFLAVCQFAGYAFWAHVLSKLNQPPGSKKPLQVPPGKFIGLSLLRAFDLAVTNSAMMFLNYPAKTLIKSCRVVFTMLMGVLIRKKRYKIGDYVAVFTLVTGLIIFLHADSNTSAVFHPWGVLLLTISLLCDGTLNNWSEQMMEEYAMTQDEFHSRLYVVSLMATVVAAHANGELVQGIQYFLFQPGTVSEIESLDPIVEPFWTIPRKAVVLILFGTSGIMGASCLGAITKRFGALSMALTSTARKATSLFLSFALFQNNCSPEHFVGVSLFMSGLLMKTFNKKRVPNAQSNVSQSAGGQPSEETNRPGPRQLDCLKQSLNGILVSLPFRTRLVQSRCPGKNLSRRRSSVDMELGIETD